jgi:hypothetical protein
MSSTPLNASTTLNDSLKQHNMLLDEYARWLCLLEGVEIVSKRVEQLKKRSIESDIDWIKPLAFQKYIDERFLSMKSDLDEIELNNAVTAPKITCTTSLAPALV